MGLDMYLTARLGICKYDKKFLKQADKTRKLFPEMFKVDNLDTIEVGFEAGYWRKANAIHKWFVDNCQEGNDDCRPGYVSRENLEELRKLCRKVLDSKDFDDEEVLRALEDDELPTVDGFFFGTSEKDEWYWDSIEHTIKIITKCLELPKEWTFEYVSSW